MLVAGEAEAVAIWKAIDIVVNETRGKVHLGLVYLEVHVKSHGSFFTNSWIKERLACSAFLSPETGVLA